MKVTLPYSYIRLLENRGELTFRMASFEIDIPEVSADEAPIVATWQNVWGGAHMDDCMVEDHACRWYDGRFYAQLRRSDGYPLGKAALTGEEAERSDASAYLNIAAFLTDGFFGHDDVMLSTSRERYFAVAGRVGESRIADRVFSRQKMSGESLEKFVRMPDTRVYDLSAAVAQASRLRLIDGILWRDASEPRLSMDSSQREAKVSVNVGPDVMSGMGVRWLSQPQPLLFRLDRYVELVETAACLRIPLAPAHGVRPPMVEMPELLVFDGKRDMVRRTLVKAVEIYGDVLGDADAETVAAYIDVRDFVSTVSDDNAGPDAMDAAVERLRHFLGLAGAGQMATEIKRDLRLCEGYPIGQDLLSASSSPGAGL